jgi:hypothetical protein
MNKSIIKKLAGGSAVLGVLLSASAQPPTASVPAGLNTSPTVWESEMPAFPGGSEGTPLTSYQELYASGGEVYVTFLGPTGAGDDEYLFVQSPANAFGDFFEDHATANGLTYDLGSYTAGTEIEFGIYDETTGYSWYDGPGSRNVDGQIHAYVVDQYEGLPNTDYVGFEDTSYGTGDFNYADEVYAFTGTSVSPVPEPSTMALFVMGGFAGLRMLRRRK